ncbi:pentapeptide repeat-containing protein [Pseudomonas putida]|uniref:pentapeptide repeat-containing protein n=1 Tax=Pseudomonas putida TaxID=303 RepID=UPI0009C014EB|nr:pentapeptide repeat-containing protein [Pseudomonas putida]
MPIETNPEHYSLLKSCAEKNDFTRWNEFVETTNSIVRLRNGDFSSWTLIGASFYTPNGDYMDLHNANFEGASIQGANFRNARMYGANFTHSTIELSSFTSAELIKVSFHGAKILMTDFNHANLQQSTLEDAIIQTVNMHETILYRANLRGTRFDGSPPLPTGFLKNSSLCGAKLTQAHFNSSTIFENYNVSTETDFRTISFESANYSQGLRHTLRYCNRRHNWSDWYEGKNRLLSTLTKFFWSLSNYGFSPSRVLASFVLSTLAFAYVYMLFPNLIKGMEPHSLMDSLYFSVVTMTTLGFGDMSAQNHWIAQLLVITQVLFGYFLLGSLITMLSELFYSDGPPQGLVSHPRSVGSMVAHFKSQDLS